MNSASPQTGAGRFRVFAMAVSAGVAVANIYYNQPMIGIILAEFHDQPAAAMIPMATQLGYALGLLFLLPLGDMLNRRRLIAGQFVILAAASGLAGLAPTGAMLVGASLLLGASATVAQQIVPFAAALAAPERRGATLGAVMAGLLSGILLSRTLSGFVGEHLGWRDMFFLGAPPALAAGGLMFAVLPAHPPVSRMRYGAALASLAHLWRREGDLRTAAFVQGGLFASFSAFWAVLALYLETPRFNLGADAAGLFGVLGAVGVFAAPMAGGVADRRGPHIVILLGASLTMLSWALFGLWASLTALIIGVVILDFGMQGSLVSNQHVIYALNPEARSRINTIFMTAMFLGGTIGSALGMVAWEEGGWSAVCLLGAAFTLASLLVKIATRKVPAPSEG